MKYLKSYISTLNNFELQKSVVETSDAVIANINARYNHTGQITGLLLGNVQSGKTGQMFGVIAKLADMGYKIFLVLTTDNVDLQRQTYNRAKTTLNTFDVLSEKDEILFNQCHLIKPILIVLKKNTRILHKWGNLIASAKVSLGLQICIFDDEADAASLNTLINKKNISKINEHLQKIKDSATACLYFQVTATPQAIILQREMSGWKPAFINYFSPGNGYLGGDFFYSQPTSYCIRFTDETELDDVKEDGDVMCPLGLRESVMSFLVVCAYKMIKGEHNCNFMIHPSVRVDVHEKFTSAVQEYLNLLQMSVGTNQFVEQVKIAWIDLQKTKPDLPHYEEIYEKIVEILDNTLVCVIPLNSRSFVCRDSNNPDALDLSKGFNIVVGGNTLGRGITFPHLQTVYYCRASKTPQADTFWQHSRIFGYDREKELVRIFMPKGLHHLFVSLNEANNILIKQITQDFEDVLIVYPNGVKPTRKSVIDNKYLNMIVGGVNLFSQEPSDKYTKEIDSLLDEYSEQDYSETDADVLISILRFAQSDNRDDFNNEKHISCIKALKQKRPSIPCKLIVRKNRDVAKGTGTLLSPTDRKIGDKFSDSITLTIYRVNGTVSKGWNGKSLWIPNIKYPTGVCFYDMQE